jgi:hypothetical protein
MRLQAMPKAAADLGMAYWSQSPVKLRVAEQAGLPSSLSVTVLSCADDNAVQPSSMASTMEKCTVARLIIVRIARLMGSFNALQSKVACVAASCPSRRIGAKAQHRHAAHQGHQRPGNDPVQLLQRG